MKIAQRKMMKNKKDLLSLLNNNKIHPSSGLGLTEVNPAAYADLFKAPSANYCIDTLLSSYGETRNPSELIGDILATYVKKYRENENYFLRRDSAPVYPSRVSINFTLGHIDIKPSRFGKKKKYALTISDSSLRCSSIIRSQKGLERASVEVVLSLARQFLMHSRRVFLIDDEENKELSAAYLSVFAAEFKAMKIYEWPNEEDQVLDQFLAAKTIVGQENITYAAGHNALSILGQVSSLGETDIRNIHQNPLIIVIGSGYIDLDKSSLPAQMRGLGISVVHVTSEIALLEESLGSILNEVRIEFDGESELPRFTINQTHQSGAGTIDFQPLPRPRLR